MTPAPFLPSPEGMKVHFKPELQAKVNRAAEQSHRSPEEYVQQLVEEHLEYDAWFREKVTASLDQLDRGESLSHEDLGGRLEQMFRS